MQANSIKPILISILLVFMSNFLLGAQGNSQASPNKKESVSMPENANWLSKNEMDKIYQFLVSNYKDQSVEEMNQEIPLALMKKFDDYGHLRFGRSNANRFKYSDPDYGHMRFGK